jgi:hypothetical protein
MYQTTIDKMKGRRKLVNHINEIDMISDQEWKASLVEYNLKELAFHDFYRNQFLREIIKISDIYNKIYG